MHADGNPPEKPYEKPSAKEKRQENVSVPRTHGLHRHQAPRAAAKSQRGDISLI